MTAMTSAAAWTQPSQASEHSAMRFVGSLPTMIEARWMGVGPAAGSGL